MQTAHVQGAPAGTSGKQEKECRDSFLDFVWLFFVVTFKFNLLVVFWYSVCVFSPEFLVALR